MIPLIILSVFTGILLLVLPYLQSYMRMLVEEHDQMEKLS